MESRKITVIASKTMTKTTLMSEAETLGELKKDLIDANVNFDGMVFFEGVSKSELLSDESILPHDLPYKGTVTNELIFMLTTPNKNIKSGAMSRSEAYAAIKKHNLEQACMDRFGANFTRCKTSDLETLISVHVEISEKKAAPKSNPVAKETKEAIDIPQCPKPKAPYIDCVDIQARIMLVEMAARLSNIFGHATNLLDAIGAHICMGLPEEVLNKTSEDIPVENAKDNEDNLDEDVIDDSDDNEISDDELDELDDMFTFIK